MTPRSLPSVRGSMLSTTLSPHRALSRLLFFHPAPPPGSVFARTTYPSNCRLSCGDVFRYKDIECVEWEPFSFRTTSTVMPPRV